MGKKKNEYRKFTGFSSLASYSADSLDVDEERKTLFMIQKMEIVPYGKQSMVVTAINFSAFGRDHIVHIIANEVPDDFNEMAK
jgi:hypothetical protein